jgi:hypothetical protein
MTPFGHYSGVGSQDYRSGKNKRHQHRISFERERRIDGQMEEAGRQL